MHMFWSCPQSDHDLSHKIRLNGDEIVGCYFDKKENLSYIGFDG